MAGDTIGFGSNNFARYVVNVDPATGAPIVPGGGGGSTTSGTATRSNVAAAIVAGVVLAANPLRKGARILNDSSAIFYGLYGPGIASSTNYSFVLAPLTASPIVPVGLPSFADIPFGFTGVVSGVSSTAIGNLRITEFS